MNLPFGLIGFIVLMKTYHDQEQPRAVHLDLAAIGSLAVGCMALLMLVSRLGPGGWPLNVSLALAANLGAGDVFLCQK